MRELIFVPQQLSEGRKQKQQGQQHKQKVEQQYVFVNAPYATVVIDEIIKANHKNVRTQKKQIGNKKAFPLYTQKQMNNVKRNKNQKKLVKHRLLFLVHYPDVKNRRQYIGVQQTTGQAGTVKEKIQVREQAVFTELCF